MPREGCTLQNVTFLIFFPQEKLITLRLQLRSILAKLDKLRNAQEDKITNHKVNTFYMSNTHSYVYFQEHSLQLQYHIALEFLKLHQFLHCKEKEIIKQLKEEGEVLLHDMEANLHKLQDQTRNAKDSLVCIQSRLYQQNSAGFLKGIKPFVDRVISDTSNFLKTVCYINGLTLCRMEQRTQNVSQSDLVTGSLCTGRYKGPIHYAAWKEMKRVLYPGKAVKSRFHSKEKTGKRRPVYGPLFSSEQEVLATATLMRKWTSCQWFLYVVVVVVWWWGSAEVSVSNESLRPEGKVSRGTCYIKSKGTEVEEALLGRGFTSCFRALLYLTAGCSVAAGPGSPRASAKNSAASGVSEAVTLGGKKQQRWGENEAQPGVKMKADVFAEGRGWHQVEGAMISLKRWCLTTKQTLLYTFGLQFIV
ncbi:hypothetical protein lerEdw1_008301 [Lerista edwardsae]|nr:hypothetical protein lerEdw1_008301 [Lerista edwardsae]